MWMVVLLLLGSSTVNSSPSCSGKTEGTLLANRHSCNSYYICNNGISILQNCEPGTSFSKDEQGCVIHKNITCRPPVKCKILKKRNPTDMCNEYRYCDGSFWQWMQCDHNEFFDRIREKCVNRRHARNDCDQCKGMPDGLVNADSDVNCSIYLACKSGSIAEILNCTLGHFFNEQTGKCSNQQPNFGKCNPAYWEDPKETGITAKRTNNGKCQEITYTNVEKACNKYLYCDGKHWQSRECKTNEFYDTIAQTCVDRKHARNDCDRCVGANRTYVNDFSKVGCNNFLICRNNKTVSYAPCVVGRYFNDEVGKCVSGPQPNFGTCNPSYWKDHPSDNEPANNKKCQKQFEKTSAIACNQYYFCDGRYWRLTQCNPNKYFDVLKQKCMDRLHARNDCDRCVGTNKTLVNSFSQFNCRDYLHCTNGTQQRMASCPNDQYFNEVVGACVEGSQPNFGACNPSHWEKSDRLNALLKFLLLKPQFKHCEVLLRQVLQDHRINWIG